MQTLEKIISVIAPHTCLVCSKEGQLICAICWTKAMPKVPSRCYLCNKLTENSQTCETCRKHSKLKHLWVRTEYSGYAKQLVRGLKFERKRAAADIIAAYLAEINTQAPQGVMIVPVPTASSRRRQRGYDQAELIARGLARRTGLSYAPLLMRSGQTRQVGAKRRARKEQLKDVFWVQRPASVKGANILLIDDVLTTGATLEAAAEELSKAGAKRINGMVFAQTKL